MHQVEPHASEHHFRVGFCPKKLPELPQSRENHTVSQSNMQVKAPGIYFGLSLRLPLPVAVWQKRITTAIILSHWQTFTIKMIPFLGSPGQV
jgi:hypothetical protein